jgi:poly-gamma-glutamate capsule biosynthesis protein CapA/YwtB (metallophosphatase superfamily)
VAAARPDVCALANNHVLDFGRRGLADTLRALSNAGLRAAGAGPDRTAARRPAAVPVRGGGRAVIISCGTASSGIPAAWAAAPGRPGVNLLPDLSAATAGDLIGQVQAARRPGDVSVVSIHWGSNWGYGVGTDQVRFARRLIDGGVDLVHGHSSHHPRPIEVFRGKLILYGCGDCIDDYRASPVTGPTGPTCACSTSRRCRKTPASSPRCAWRRCGPAGCSCSWPRPPTGSGSERYSTGSAAGSAHESISSRTACSPCA